LHEEGISFGKDGYEKVAIEKGKLFKEIHPSIISSLKSFESRPRLLFIDAYLPMPDKGSGSIDAMAYLKYFLDHGIKPIVYAHHHNNYFEKYTQSLELLGIEVLQDNFKSLEETILDQGQEICAVFVSRYYQMDHFLPLLKRHLSHAKLIYNTVDLHFLRESRESALADNSSVAWLNELKAKELSYIKYADASIVISKFEHDMLNTLLPETSCIYHIPQTRPFMGTTNGCSLRKGFIFIGSAHQPNVDALRYFQDVIHPILVKYMPDYTLGIIGKELHESLSEPRDKDLLNNPHIRFLGFVEDPSLLFDRAIAMVVPLRYGSGIKGKVVQSIQYAIPCVTTSIGAEGLDLPKSSSVIVSNSPNEIAENLYKLSVDADLWQRASSLAEGIYDERFSEKIFTERVDKLMAQLKMSGNINV